MSLMRAIVRRGYGTPDVLRMETIERPVAGRGEVLVRVRAAALNPLDWYFLDPPLLVRRLLGSGGRTIPGVDAAGTVEAVGPGVTSFGPGDEVFGFARGSLAEYVRAREDSIAAKPRGVSFEQAAAAPVAGLTAIQALRDHAALRAGQRVLVNGAAGGVGTFAVQVARSLGAEVTGVCSAANLELVRSLGAAQVVDYAREDFVRGGARYDVMLDNVGNRPLADCRRVLRPGGIYLANGVPKKPRLSRLVPRLLGVLVVFRLAGRQGKLFITRPSRPDLRALGESLASGTVVPVLDRVVPLAEAGEAMRHLGRGHARGKIVITI